MEKSQKLQSIMKKGRHLFICEQQQKINKMMVSLMKYCLYKNKEEQDELKLFFHSLKGTGAIFNFEKISNIGKEYEDYICSIENESELSEDVFYTLLKGLAQAYDEIEKLNKECKIEENEEKLIENKGELIENEDKIKGNKGTILIVDDDITLLNQLEKVFKYEGYNVISIDKPQEAIKIIQEEKIDIILLDIMMPKIDGFEVFNEIQKEKLDIPIIFLTAKTFIEDKITALNSGADDYITKPFKIEEVLARVNRALQRNSNYRIDELTGAYTKRHFTKRIKEVQNKFLKHGEIYSIAFIDIDYFKEINDTYGHMVGDIILKKFANSIKSTIRSKDELFRFGGDEFIVIFPKATDDQVYNILERIKKEIQSNVVYCNKTNKPINIFFSAGIGTIKDANQSIEELIEITDKYLYISKQQGRNKITYQENAK
ncbi:diguanylate cyclase [Romboutsia sp.]|uniref:GGDEF domain-containing response regulator n=1 Tax=Romboutsia sp. TaxID=1965302 RepID=UPI002B87F203|nr:diguanylate cyclase [Romboutsia sp.]HSQ87539.1 diguanylate cyclase [Romboutsia sp.]